MDVPFTIAISVAAFAVATLVLMSGFGLSTTLTPLLALAYPVHIAVMLVAIVHFSNSLVRLALFFRHADWGVVARFGILSIAGALVGALSQAWIGPAPLKIALGAVLVFFGSVELIPRLGGLRIPRRFAPVGGIVSGFLCGLTGNQGAIRSAYLLNYGLSKEAFIGTGTILASLIDATRIPIYVARDGGELREAWPTLVAVVLSAWAGTLVGRRLLPYVSLARFRQVVGAAVVVIGLLMVLRVV